MTNNFRKVLNPSMMIILFSLLFSTTILAQKKVRFEVEKNEGLVEAMKQENLPKGITNYTVMKMVFQKKNSQEVKLTVVVDREQKVIVEIFNEEGRLISVLYNDYLSAENAKNFTADGTKWKKNASHYIRVTTEDYIENHEIVLKKCS